jgi:hypothetical protein
VAAAFKSIEGAVQVKPWGELDWLAATPATALREEDLVRTRSNGRAEIRMNDGTDITMGPDALIRVEASRADAGLAASRPSMSVQAGEVNFQTSGTGSERTTLGTPAVTARVGRDSTGSLQVGEDGATGLRLFRGEGEAETKTGQKVALGPNEGVQVAAGGTAGAKVALPAAPRLVAPSDQAAFTSRDLARNATTLHWAVVPGASQYRVMVDLSPSFARPLHDRKDHASAPAELTGLDAGSYFWRVAAMGKDGLEGPYSETWRFTLAKGHEAPPPPLEIETLELKGSVLNVRGRTEPGATLVINGEPVRVEADGRFAEFLAVPPSANPEVLIRSTSRAGGVAELRRRPPAGR